MDVLSALVNLGSQRTAAENAIRKPAMAGAGARFEDLFASPRNCAVITALA